MSNIDLARLITADDKAVLAAAAAQDAAKTECRRRIVAVVDETAQLNINAAINAGLLDTPQLAIYQAGVLWIAAMRSAWPTVTDPTDDTQWPDVPAGVAELAAAF